MWAPSAAEWGAGKLEHVALGGGACAWVLHRHHGRAPWAMPCDALRSTPRQTPVLGIAKFEFQNDSRGRGRHRAYHGTGFVMCRGGWVCALYQVTTQASWKMPAGPTFTFQLKRNSRQKRFVRAQQIVFAPGPKNDLFGPNKSFLLPGLKTICSGQANRFCSLA